MWCMLSIASSCCILTISRDFYPKIWRRLGTETTRLDLERQSRLSRLNGGDSQISVTRQIGDCAKRGPVMWDWSHFAAWNTFEKPCFSFPSKLPVSLLRTNSMYSFQCCCFLWSSCVIDSAELDRLAILSCSREKVRVSVPVSYTHLTLPTILRV